MNDPEDFLTRWSRRKRDAADADMDRAPQASPDTAEPSGATSSAGATQDAPSAAAQDAESATGADGALPDFAHLPSIEEITAETDIRGFLAPGVPAELRRAALRRAWSADPAIRDFVGLAENDFDFNNPDSIPGFGKLEMTPALRREVARIVGDLISDEDAPRDEPAAALDTQATETAAEIAEAEPPNPAISVVIGPATAARQDLSGPDKLRFRPYQGDIAAQQDGGEAERPENLPLPAKRSHGGALPQ